MGACGWEQVFHIISNKLAFCFVLEWWMDIVKPDGGSKWGDAA
jgi:hypothetical protein